VSEALAGSAVEGLVAAISDFLEAALGSLVVGKPAVFNRTESEGRFRVETSLRVSSLEDMFLERAPSLEPLIDVIEDEDETRVVVLLPGVELRDVSTRFEGEDLVIRLAKGSRVFERRIPSGIPGGKVRVKSRTSNNSVVELVFAKRGVA
jgi:hypothetical protein